jgi:hypothetical protein
MRILHLTTVRTLYSGQRRQLRFEVDAATFAHLPWRTIALHAGASIEDFEVRAPQLFRGRLMLRLYGWLYAIKYRDEYDLILFRDMQLDIFGPLLGRFVPNRITVHHARELEELSILRGGGILAKAAVFIERYFKPITMRSAIGIAGVTSEIRDYEAARFPSLASRTLVMPNGYNFEASKPANDLRAATQKDIAFVCAEFSEWHGLDRIINYVKSLASPPKVYVNFHLVGDLTTSQKEEIRRLDIERIRFVLHGSLTQTGTMAVLAKCHVAIGSLALDRKGLAEATTLKVREYLGAGIPVYSAHRDTSLPYDFPYYFNDQNGFSLERLLIFEAQHKDIAREAVREASREYLDKEHILVSTMSKLAVMYPEIYNKVKV